MSKLKQSSKRRIESSRANGAKSRGPVTPEGKAKVSQNAVKHGYLAAMVTLSPDEEDIFREIHQAYILRFEPRDQVEHDLVEQIVWANWKMRKIWMNETSVIGLQVALDRDKVGMEWLTPNQQDREALATVECLKDSKALELFSRYSRTLAGQAERATKLLLELKKLRLPPALVPPKPEVYPVPESQPEAQEPNRPNPKNGHIEIPSSEPVAYVRNAENHAQRYIGKAQRVITVRKSPATVAELPTSHWPPATERTMAA